MIELAAASVLVALIAHHAFMAWLVGKREADRLRADLNAISEAAVQCAERQGKRITALENVVTGDHQSLATVSGAVVEHGKRIATLESNDRMREGMRRS